MEIKDINPTSKATFKVIGADGSEQMVTFTISFIGEQMIPDYVRTTEIDKIRLSNVVQEALVDAVLAWDLTMDAKPVLCTEENKRKFFPGILGLKLAKDPAKPKAERGLNEFLGWSLVNFASNQENFLKN